MTSVAPLAALLALGVILLIGFDLLLRVPKRREDGGVRAATVPVDADPANLRRRRPLTQRLSGAVLIVAAAVLYLVIRPALGL
jgi:hypothetical protein